MKTDAKVALKTWLIDVSVNISVHVREKIINQEEKSSSVCDVLCHWKAPVADSLRKIKFFLQV